MNVIKEEEISSGLEQSSRVYLCGNLKMGNTVEHIPTDSYEIGVTQYSEFSADKAHIHTFNTEYNYVLEGSIKIFLIDEKKEVLLKKGDLFVINVGEPYMGKALPGTKVIFSKVPGGNDKKLIEIDKKMTEWCKSWESVYRGNE